MKKVYLTSFLIFFLTQFVISQEISFKYGKVTQDELQMMVYDKDTSAVAVVLYEDGYTYYNYYDKTGFQVTFELKKKIKILKQEGNHKGDISIIYYHKGGGDRETISGLEATAYNLENGKIVKTRLEKKYIFEEEINSNYRQLKFSLPNVKAGTVIEYKYRKTSPFTFDIPDWNVQSDIPVMNSYYEVLIPEYYHFNIDAARGYERIKTEETTQSQSFNLGMYNGQPMTVNSNSRLLKFTAKDVPALKPEPHVWCVNDFTSGVSLEISGTKFPNAMYKPYTNSWRDIEKTLKDKTDFGSNMKMSNPYKDEVRKIVEESQNEEEIISGIYALVKSKIRWDESYSFYGNKARDAVKNGTGDNGQINMVLLSMFKDAKIIAYPVLISRRNYGRLPYTRASLDKLNTFLVAAETSDGKQYYMDGSAVHGGLNVLPVSLLVDRAWAFKENIPGDKWVDLTSLVKNQIMIIQTASINENGVMTCEKNTRFTNQLAYSFKSDFFSKKDSVEYIENYENSNEISIDEHALTGLEPMSNIVNQKMTFKKDYAFEGNYIYINPMLFPHIDENPFTQSERKLPIEFNYPYTFVMNVVLTIPENYIIEELPSSLNMSLDDNKGKCIYHITEISENTLQLNYRFELNQIIFPQMDYEAIKDFFGRIATKNNELIVLKKV